MLKRSTEEGARTNFWKRAVVAAEFVVVPGELVLAAGLDVAMELAVAAEVKAAEDVELSGCIEFGRQVTVLARRATDVRRVAEKCILNLLVVLGQWE